MARRERHGVEADVVRPELLSSHLLEQLEGKMPRHGAVERRHVQVEAVGAHGLQEIKHLRPSLRRAQRVDDHVVMALSGTTPLPQLRQDLQRRLAQLAAAQSLQRPRRRARLPPPRLRHEAMATSGSHGNNKLGHNSTELPLFA